MAEGFTGGQCFRSRSVASALGPPTGTTPKEEGLRWQPQSGESLKRKTVLAIVVNHAATFTSLADGLLCGAFGTIGLLHDFFS